MNITFLPQEYVALVLIEAKEKMFVESFVTTSELNQFSHYMQKEFNKNGVNTIISTGKFNKDNFDILNGIIIMKDKCDYNLDIIPVNILEVLTDNKLIINFLKQLEEEKVTKLNEIELNREKEKILK